MSKLSLLVSAIILSATINARATTVMNITFNNFCDGMQLQTSDGTNFSSTETGACLGGVTVSGSGRVHRRDLTLIVNWAPFEGQGGVATHRYLLQYPLVTGGTWKEFIPVKNCGKNCVIYLKQLNQGTFTVQH